MKTKSEEILDILGTDHIKESVKTHHLLTPRGAVTSFEVKGMGKFKLALVSNKEYEKQGIDSTSFAYVSEDGKYILNTTVADPGDSPNLMFSKAGLKEFGENVSVEFMEFAE